MIKTDEIVKYISEHICEFHTKRLASLRSQNINKLLRHKNPYLFKAKNILTVGELVRTILDAHLSSAEETIFGDFLERLAIFVAEKAFNGQKSAAEGIDLDLSRDNIRYIVSIKSGPNWGNASQIAKMRASFTKAKRILRTSGGSGEIIAINGCCYGRDDSPDKGDYQKLCGQRFWEFISDDTELYTRIIEPLGYQAKARNDEFLDEYAKMINNLTSGFIAKFCKTDGAIDWNALVKYNSEKDYD
jgi:hypothetical protein